MVNPLPDIIPSDYTLQCFGNDERIAHAIKILVAHPERHDQRHWWSRKGLDGYVGVSAMQVDASCGTACCLRGWGEFLKPEADRRSDFYPGGSDPYGFDGGMQALLYYEGNKRKRLIKALKLILQLPEQHRRAEVLNAVGMDGDWMVGNGKGIITL